MAYSGSYSTGNSGGGSGYGSTSGASYSTGTGYGTGTTGYSSTAGTSYGSGSAYSSGTGYGSGTKGAYGSTGYGSTTGGAYGSYGSGTGTGGYGSAYSSGIWHGTNAVFPPLPQGQPPPPGTTKTVIPPQQPQISAATLPPQQQARPTSYNFKLRRAIHPRAPLTILNDLAGTEKVQFDYLDVPFIERQRRAWQMGVDVDQVGIFECRCRVQDLEFIAEGATKVDAKNAVSDLAIQGLISKKCELNDWEGVGSTEDNCPWSVLASLALYRLYADWQTQGYTLPNELANMPGPNNLGTKKSGQDSGQDTFFDKPGQQDKPALQLINEMASRMKLCIEFEMTGEVGQPNDKVFTMTLKVGESTYSGQGKSKKAAKQIAAQMAMDDKDSWYVVPVEEPYDEEEEAEEEPPSKKPTLDEEQDTQDQEDTEQDTGDKGQQPGSHPANK